MIINFLFNKFEFLLHVKNFYIIYINLYYYNLFLNYLYKFIYFINIFLKII
jgi:hypothetical protein